MAWLEADLAATSQPWKVAFFHRSPYSSGAEHGSDLAVRSAFGPMFEKHGVQLVLSAHEHDYERLVPWRREHRPDACRRSSTSSAAAAVGRVYAVGPQRVDGG